MLVSVRALGRLPSQRRACLAEALLAVNVARVAVRLLPFRWVAACMGEHMAESATEMTGPARETATRVAWAVHKVARRVALPANCLPQAVAAKFMLRRRGVACTLYLGVLGVENLRAHAWVRAGDVIVTGRRGMLGYTVVSTFA